MRNDAKIAAKNIHELARNVEVAVRAFDMSLAAEHFDSLVDALNALRLLDEDLFEVMQVPAHHALDAYQNMLAEEAKNVIVEMA